MSTYVFFDGFGSWLFKREPHYPFTGIYASGYFMMSAHHERKFKYMNELPTTLMPCDIKTKACSFNMLFVERDMPQEVNNNSFEFLIDTTKPYSLKVVTLNDILQDPFNDITQEKELSETERQTMLKLILGMAIDAYGYNPKASKNAATGDKNGIAARLAARGITISDDTIRKYLNESKDLL